MMCLFCGNRKKCWDDKSDDELELEWVKCSYEDYVLDEWIDIEDLLAESTRRIESDNE